MSDRPNRNEQRRARLLAAQEGISYQRALQRLREDAPGPGAAAATSIAGVDVLRPGQTRTVIVAWRPDDPAVKDDGRFWYKVRGATAGVFDKPVGSIVPKGQSLGWWRARATGHEAEVVNPITRDHEWFSLERWSDADPQRTYVVLAFYHADEELVGRLPEDIERIRAARPGAQAAIDLGLSEEAQCVRSQQAELQREFRDARAGGDDARMRNLAAALEATSDELRRLAFPDFVRGWNLSRAIQQDPSQFVLDWLTGY